MILAGLGKKNESKNGLGIFTKSNFCLEKLTNIFRSWCQLAKLLHSYQHDKGLELCSCFA